MHRLATDYNFTSSQKYKVINSNIINILHFLDVVGSRIAHKLIGIFNAHQLSGIQKLSLDISVRFFSNTDIFILDTFFTRFNIVNWFVTSIIDEHRNYIMFLSLSLSLLVRNISNLFPDLD